MLGKLARWLRLLGYDAVYESGCDDTGLLRLASEEDRVLVTRDRDLHRKAIGANIATHLLEAGSLSDWLGSLHERYRINLILQTVSPRCSLCNSPLDAASRDIIIKTVPTRIQPTHSEFWHCPNCEKTYWQGTHWDNMRAFLTSISKK